MLNAAVDEVDSFGVAIEFRRELNDVLPFDFVAVFDLVNFLPDDTVKVEITMELALKFADENLLFDVTLDVGVAGGLVIDEVVFIAAEDAVVFVAKFEILLTFGLGEELGDLFVCGVVADNEVRIDGLDIGEFFRDGCAKAEEIIDCGGEALFVVAFQTLDISKHSGFAYLVGADDDETVFENLHAELLAGVKHNKFLAGDTVFDAADVEISAELEELFLIKFELRSAVTKEVVDFGKLEHGTLEPAADVDVIDFHETSVVILMYIIYDERGFGKSRIMKTMRSRV